MTPLESLPVSWSLASDVPPVLEVGDEVAPTVVDELVGTCVPEPVSDAPPVGPSLVEPPCSTLESGPHAAIASTAIAANILFNPRFLMFSQTDSSRFVTAESSRYTEMQYP